VLRAIRRRRREPVSRSFVLGVLVIWLTMALTGYCLRLIPTLSSHSFNQPACHLINQAKTPSESGKSTVTVCLDVNSAHSAIHADSIPDPVHFLIISLSTVTAVVIALCVQIRPRKRDPPTEYSWNPLYYVFCSQLK